MKPKNFPGKINKRKTKALERLNNYTEKSDYTKKQIEILKEKILPQNEAECIRTKIARTK